MGTSFTRTEELLLKEFHCDSREKYIDRIGLKVGDEVFACIRLMNYEDLWVLATFRGVDQNGIKVQLKQPPNVDGEVIERYMLLNEIKKTDARPPGIKEDIGEFIATYYVTVTVAVGMAAPQTSELGKLMLCRKHEHPRFKELITPVLADQLETLIEHGMLTDCIESIDLSTYS